ncbi:unnamed protein product [Acanthoscelides obtectus]|uniref:Uncharacterized protein n=1 Tax=Acanthoscelides obtectus TaxID=200917 RepID=A0A9P0MAF9_ACAOB|nr:unnamed protein product [Acanthoscelides obtectus]CAK1656054.1 hypothetical protein AOBTE_LOCUS19550 [Acanthoscelides obtectus]
MKICQMMIFTEKEHFLKFWWKPAKRNSLIGSHNWIKKEISFCGNTRPKNRRDNVGHLPEWYNITRDANFLNVRDKQVSCVKCNVRLCLNKDRNCFRRVHLE